LKHFAGCIHRSLGQADDCRLSPPPPCRSLPLEAACCPRGGQVLPPLGAAAAAARGLDGPRAGGVRGPGLAQRGAHRQDGGRVPEAAAPRERAQLRGRCPGAHGRGARGAAGVRLPGVTPRRGLAAAYGVAPRHRALCSRTLEDLRGGKKHTDTMHRRSPG
ncbi:unnamed protein product, partial [Prorocentrum cordatum]